MKSRVAMTHKPLHSWYLWRGFNVYYMPNADGQFGCLSFPIQACRPFFLLQKFQEVQATRLVYHRRIRIVCRRS